MTATANILTLAQAGSPLWLTLAVSAAALGFVVCLIVALFGHSGRTEISPHRRVAMAMGKADRRTVFEMDLIGPIMWLLLQLMESLELPDTKRRVRKTLIAAGSPNFYTAEEYLALALLWGIGGAVVLGGLNYLLLEEFSAVATGFGFVAGVAWPLYSMHDQARRRVRKIGRHVPYSLDLIALAMGAGSTFTEALQTVVRDAPDDPLNVEFNTVLAEIELGATRRQALANLTERVPLDSLRSITASIIQAEELGTPLTRVLKNQAELLRRHRSARAEKLAALASVRILIPSLLILLSVVLTVFAPVIIRAIQGELF